MRRPSVAKPCSRKQSDFQRLEGHASYFVYRVDSTVSSVFTGAARIRRKLLLVVGSLLMLPRKPDILLSIGDVDNASLGPYRSLPVIITKANIFNRLGKIAQHGGRVGTTICGAVTESHAHWVQFRWEIYIWSVFVISVSYGFDNNAPF